MKTEEGQNGFSKWAGCPVDFEALMKRQLSSERDFLSTPPKEAPPPLSPGKLDRISNLINRSFDGLLSPNFPREQEDLTAVTLEDLGAGMVIKYRLKKIIVV